MAARTPSPNRGISAFRDVDWTQPPQGQTQGRGQAGRVWQGSEITHAYPVQSEEGSHFHLKNGRKISALAVYAYDCGFQVYGRAQGDSSQLAGLKAQAQYGGQAPSTWQNDHKNLFLQKGWDAAQACYARGIPAVQTR